ncbi:MAG TPA: aldo/keto reductase [Chloroflexota bacterium]|nr:aldo/keto reductase [Chloroflexota bacterium]
MKYGSIPGVGERVSRLILGSDAFSSLPVESVEELLDAWVAAGGTAVETAHDYGVAERRIGDWARRRGNRDQLMIMTKCAHHDEQTLARRVTPEAISQDLLESLDRLGVATIDLLMLHRDDPAVPVGPIVDCLNEHRQAGRIRAFGCSNWSIRRIEEANAYAAARGLRGFSVSSPNLALAVPKEPLWHETVSIAGDGAAQAWYRRTQLPLILWSSQARGFFAGPFALDDPRTPEIARVYDGPANEERRRRAREAAARHGRTSTQIALAWVLNQPFPTFPLIGPRNVAELRDCLGALEIPLTAEESAWLNLAD